MHMMVARPEQWVQPMAVAGANQYTFHLEATDGPGALIKDIRENGMKVSAARGRDPRGVARRLARFPTLPPTPPAPPLPGRWGWPSNPAPRWSSWRRGPTRSTWPW